MCQYRITTFACGHTRKLCHLPCHRPACTSSSDEHDLSELTRDLSDVRAAIRMCHEGRNLPGYQRLLGKLQRNFPSWFGHGSGNSNRTIVSLGQLEAYLDYEVAGVATNVTARDWSDRFCLDACWEGLVAIGREEQWRRGYFQGSHGG